MAGEPYEREKHHWWKAKKWAYFNLNRLFIRSVQVLQQVKRAYFSN